MSNSIDRIFDNCLPIVHWLLSPACLLCGGQGDQHGLCDGCSGSLPRLGSAHCPICALPNPTGELCGRCLAEPPHFDRVIAAFTYEYPATVLIQELKYRGNLACARPLSAGMADALDTEPYPDLVIPMPLAPVRLANRGFNQVMESRDESPWNSDWIFPWMSAAGRTKGYPRHSCPGSNGLPICGTLSHVNAT